jgi:hypothetical protein
MKGLMEMGDGKKRDTNSIPRHSLCSARGINSLYLNQLNIFFGLFSARVSPVILPNSAPEPRCSWCMSTGDIAYEHSGILVVWILKSISFQLSPFFVPRPVYFTRNFMIASPRLLDD